MGERGTRAPGMLARFVRRIGAAARTRVRSFIGLVISAVTAVGATRQLDHETVTLPDPVPLATTAAAAVHNAAKASVIQAIRQAEIVDDDRVGDAVRQAMIDGAEAGADVTAVAVGAVEGVIVTAAAMTRAPWAATATGHAARAAVATANAQGAAAGRRVAEALAAALDYGSLDNT